MTDREVEAAWNIGLEDLADLARRFDGAAADEKYPPRADRYRTYATYLLAVLQARAVLEAAERSDTSARRLVFATWALVLVTAVLATAALLAR